MTLVFLIGVIVFGVVILALIGLFGRKMPTHLNQKHFQDKWLELLGRVKTPEGMVLAVIDADKLLDEALRKKHFRGKTTGERLVAAQRILSDNDAVWFAHKMRNRLVHESNQKLRKKEAIQALEGFKQGLRDLGAL